MHTCKICAKFDFFRIFVVVYQPTRIFLSLPVGLLDLMLIKNHTLPKIVRMGLPKWLSKSAFRACIRCVAFGNLAEETGLAPTRVWIKSICR